MPKQHNSSSNLAQQVQITYLVRAYGVTRDQARRLLSKIGNNRAKLDEAARILKARSPSRYADHFDDLIVDKAKHLSITEEERLRNGDGNLLEMLLKILSAGQYRAG